MGQNTLKYEAILDSNDHANGFDSSQSMKPAQSGWKLHDDNNDLLNFRFQNSQADSNLGTKAPGAFHVDYYYSSTNSDSSVCLLDKYNMGYVELNKNGESTIEKVYVCTQDYPYTLHTLYQMNDNGFSPQPEPEPEPFLVQCLNQESNNSVQMQNPYLFNNIPYNNYDKIGVNIGTYTLTGISSTHPLGFVTTNEILEVLSGTPNQTKIVEELSIVHYTGTIIFQVKQPFDTISYHCANHGYMGGQHRLYFSNTV